LRAVFVVVRIKRGVQRRFVLEQVVCLAFQSADRTECGVPGGDMGDLFALSAILLVSVGERRLSATVYFIQFARVVEVVCEGVEFAGGGGEFEVLEGERGAAALVGGIGAHDFAGAVHVEEAGEGEVAGGPVGIGLVGELAHSSEDGDAARVGASGSRVLLLEGDDPFLEGRRVATGAELEPGIRSTHVGEERAHVAKGRLHCTRSDGVTAF
jgi:hypothetical protein